MWVRSAARRVLDASTVHFLLYRFAHIRQERIEFLAQLLHPAGEPGRRPQLRRRGCGVVGRSGGRLFRCFFVFIFVWFGSEGTARMYCVVVLQRCLCGLRGLALDKAQDGFQMEQPNAANPAWFTNTHGTDFSLRSPLIQLGARATAV